MHNHFHFKKLCFLRIVVLENINFVNVINVVHILKDYWEC